MNKSDSTANLFAPLYGKAYIESSITSDASVFGRLAVAHEYESKPAMVLTGREREETIPVHELSIDPVASTKASQISVFAPSVSPVIPPMRRLQIRALAKETSSTTSTQMAPRRHPININKASAVALLRITSIGPMYLSEPPTPPSSDLA